MLTQNDLTIQKKLIILIKKFFPDIEQFVCEENFNIKNFKEINFNKSFAIIDPIDGTENFFAENEMFGTLISINSKSSIKLDLIYLPAKKIIITEKIFQPCLQNLKKIIKFRYFTKCLNKNYRGSKYRMYGSSAYSFYKFIIGEANEYVYCEGAKIWDCFTGLRLASLINCKMKIQNKNWINNPKYKMKFKLKWT